MNPLHDTDVLILGLGASGLAMARWCARHGARVRAWDSRDDAPNAAALAAEVPGSVRLSGALDATALEGVTRVFKSPGLSPSDARLAVLLGAARLAAIPVQGELDLFAQALAALRAERHYAPQVLAITGTNGKTTTTALTGQLVERAGRRVAVAGNIGPSMLATLAAALDAQAVADAQAQATAAAEAALAVTDDDRAGPETIQEIGLDIEAEEDEGIETGPIDVVVDVDLVVHMDDDLVTVDDEDDAGFSDTLAEELPGFEETATAGLDVLPPALAATLPAAPPAPVFACLPEVWVLELSSFQLDGVQGFEPTAAAVLNVTQDHLDWHGTMEHYAAAKARIFGRDAVMVINRDDARVAAMVPAPVLVKSLMRGRPAKAVSRRVTRFGLDAPRAPGDFGLVTVNGMAWLARALERDDSVKLRKGEEEELHVQRLMPADALRIRGRHNAANALAALALASAADCALAPLLHGLRDYRGEPHRVEPIGMVGDVEFVDDSKGTNVGATAAALSGLGEDRAPGKLVLILGGDGKGQDFTPLAEGLRRHARAAATIGRDAAALEAVLQSAGVPFERHVSLEEATRWCLAQAQPGDAVLLSPACASLDMFRDYAHRAQVFAHTYAALLAERGGVTA